MLTTVWAGIVTVIVLTLPLPVLPSLEVEVLAGAVVGTPLGPVTIVKVTTVTPVKVVCEFGIVVTMIGVIEGLLLRLDVIVMRPLLVLGLTVTVYALILLIGIVEALANVVASTLVAVDAGRDVEADPTNTVTTLPFGSVVVEPTPQILEFACTLEICADAVLVSCGILNEG